MQGIHPVSSASTKTSSSAEGHFLLYFNAVIARMLTNLSTLETANGENIPFEQFPFLVDYRNMLHMSMPAQLSTAMEDTWWEEQITNMEAQTPDHLPLRTLQVEAGLSTLEIYVL